MSTRKLFSTGCCAVTVWLVVSVLAGCSGTGGDEMGSVQIAVTDAATDEIDRFEVDVVSIHLVRNDGAMTSALPLSTRVDFAELVGLAELVNAASVPMGTYVEARITLDFSSATVHIVGAASDATVLDGTGSPFGAPVSVNVQLSVLNRLVVAPGETRIFTLDLDLNASTAVDVPGNTVQVSPIIVADVDLSRPRAHRIRGPLESVDTTEDSFVLAVRPSDAVVMDFGAVRVTTDAATFFEIDGVPFQGGAGIDEMANLTAFTAVVAVGEFDGQGTFVAEEVLAGSSVAGGTLDVATGLVVARAGDTLTLRGARLDRAAGVVTFNEDVTIPVDPVTTRVVRQVSTAALTTDAISVGQRIVVFGTLDPGAPAPAFAQSDWVRLIRTGISGTVNTVAAGSLEVDVARIGLREIGDFDFTSTGAVTDSNPLAYEIDTGALDLSGLAAGDPVRVLGFVTPFGSAQPDFEALSVSDLSRTSLMGVVWASDSTSQFSSLSDSRIDLDLTDAMLVHHVDRAGALTDLTGLPSPAVLPAGTLGLYAIFDQGNVSLFSSFAGFVLNLQAHTSTGGTVQRLAALGAFDDATGELAATVVVVVLNP